LPGATHEPLHRFRVAKVTNRIAHHGHLPLFVTGTRAKLKRSGGGRARLSRTLKTMEDYGLVRLERGERGRITPKVAHDRVELDLPLTWSKGAERKREAV
jgi:hypothetical protein